MKTLRILFGLALAASLVAGVRNLHRFSHEDFYVYDTAAFLVRSGQSLAIYDGADTGVDPQLRTARPDSKFAETARALGISEVRLYVYPPLLADLMVPFSLVRANIAAWLWVATCVGMLIFAGIIASRSMGALWGSAAMLAMISGALAMGLYSMRWGQVTPLLFLLWTLGIFTYRKESPTLSAMALALAGVIKLTPILVVIPFIVLWEWKWLRAYLLSMIALILCMAAVNGPACLIDFQTRVLPSMSGGLSNVDNFSFSSAFQEFYKSAYYAYFHASPVTLTPAEEAASLCSLLVMILVCWMIYPRRGKLSLTELWGILAAVSLLSASLAPVSWRQAYIVAVLPLSFLWLDLFRNGLRTVSNWMLIAATLVFFTFLRDPIFLRLGFFRTLCIPVTGVFIALLCIVQTRKLRLYPAETRRTLSTESGLSNAALPRQ